MKFKGLNGRIYSIDIRPSKYPVKDENNCKSKFQWRIGQKVKSLYPRDNILEDFYVPGEGLYIDFYLPMRQLAVEANGVQHSSYSDFFHGSKEAFKNSLMRDTRKIEWCKLNCIKLICIEYNDDDSEIIRKLSR